MQSILFDGKRDDEQEFSLYLFEYCNLACTFCWQDHNDKIGIETVLSKLDPIEKWLAKEPKKTAVFTIMGGEVFANQVFTREMLDAYKTLTSELKRFGEKYSKTININWVSNLVTDKIDYIDELLDYGLGLGLQVKLVTSYDPMGRFNRTTFEVFKRNMEYFDSRVSGVSMTMTKPNVERIMSKGDEYFDYMYNQGKYIYFDYYMPDKSAARQFASDALLFEFFKFLIAKYPEVDPVKSWIENDTNYMTCRTSKMVLSDGSMCLCGNLVQDLNSKIQYVTNIKPFDNTPIEDRFLEKYNCFECEYYKKCGMGCFMRHDYKFAEEMDECLYKLTHRHIDMVKLQTSTFGLND